jgi:transposase-like protein
LCSWKDVDHATAYGAEFRQDVIDVARKGEAPLAQIAKDFGLSVTTLKRWIAIAERKESGAGPLGGVGLDAGAEEAQPPLGAGE